MIIDLTDIEYEYIEVSNISKCNIDAMDIEVDKVHYYILENGIISHNSISLLTQTTSGIEPLYSMFYNRRKKITEGDNSTPDFVDTNGDKYKNFKVFHPKLKDWQKICNNDDISQSPYYKSCAYDICWKNRVILQATANKFIDHSISSTINLPSDVSVEDVKTIYETAYSSGCKGITVYRDGCRSGILINDSKPNKDNSIQYHDAPKRPKKLPCDIFHVSVKGTPYFVLVGKLNENPYEVFAGEDKDNIISKSLKGGSIIKKARGQYCISEESDDEKVIHNNISTYIGEDYEAITRLISSNLRHGCNVNFVVHQLEKTRGDFMSFSKAIARVLKKYIKEGEAVSGEECPQCGEKLIRVEGCVRCKSCSWSKC